MCDGFHTPSSYLITLHAEFENMIVTLGPENVGNFIFLLLDSKQFFHDELSAVAVTAVSGSCGLLRTMYRIVRLIYYLAKSFFYDFE